MRGKIRFYFERFGKVESVRVRSKDDFHYGFVRFQRADSAKKALSKNKHNICGRIVKVKAADDRHQPNSGFKEEEEENTNDNKATAKSSTNPAPIPDQESISYIALNNEVILKQIFKHLPLQDLCNAAEVCVRFQQIAQEYFKLHYNTLCIAELCLPGDDDTKITLPIAEKLFRNFAKFVNTLKLTQNVFEDDDGEALLKMVNKYFTGTLTELFMYGFNINRALSYALRPLFARLVKLVIYNVHGTKALRNLLAVCDELKSLRIGHCFMVHKESLTQHFAKLESLEFDGIFGLWPEILSQVLILNPNLQSLKIAHTHMPHLTSQIYPIISELLPKLQRFYYNSPIDTSGDPEIDKNVQSLMNMKSLKTLQLNCEILSVQSLVDSLLEQKTVIEKFGIIGGTIDKEICAKLSKWSHLTALHLIGTKMDHMKLIDLAKVLPRLAELYIQNLDGVNMNALERMLPHANNLHTLDIVSIKSDMVMSIDNYNTVLNIVKNRANGIKLTINMHGKRNVSVPRSLIQTNCYWLDIKQTGSEDPDLYSEPISARPGIVIIHRVLVDINNGNDDENNMDIEDEDMEHEEDDQLELEVEGIAAIRHANQALGAMLRAFIAAHGAAHDAAHDAAHGAAHGAN